jgi:hypothetical protein
VQLVSRVNQVGSGHQAEMNQAEIVSGTSMSKFTFKRGKNVIEFELPVPATVGQVRTVLYERTGIAGKNQRVYPRFSSCDSEISFVRPDLFLRDELGCSMSAKNKDIKLSYISSKSSNSSIEAEIPITRHFGHDVYCRCKHLPASEQILTLDIYDELVWTIPRHLKPTECRVLNLTTREYEICTVIISTRKDRYGHGLVLRVTPGIDGWTTGNLQAEISNVLDEGKGEGEDIDGGKLFRPRFFNRGKVCVPFDVHSLFVLEHRILPQYLANVLAAIVRSYLE